MTLYIDMIAFYLQKAGGITVVWKELITRMLRDKWNLVLILQNAKCNNIYFEEIMSLEPKFICEAGVSVKANRYRPVNNFMEKGSAFASTYYRVVNNKNIRQYTLVHDFTYEYYAKGIRKIVHQWQKRKSVRKADVVICVSENTKKDLVMFYPWANDKKVHVIYNGVSNTYEPISTKNNSNIRNEKSNYPFFLYVGSRAKYKRFDLAVDIAEYYGYMLLIIGGGRLNEDECCYLENRIKGNYIQKLGIEEVELNEIYNSAVALLYPSEYEGFGIPILEAQKAGCPVVARKGSSVDEVVNNDDILMKESTLDEARRVIGMLKDDTKRSQIIEYGYANASRFSWDITYDQYRKLIK